MPQLFKPYANLAARVSLILAVGAMVAGAAAWWGWYHSPYQTMVGETVEQPVPFSHAHHVGGLGLGCRYCHTSVQASSFAGLPPSSTCMNCHLEIWTQADLLEPVRESWRTGMPIRWNRVNRLPDYVYFNHSIHVDKGFACVTCHGQVDRMPLMEKGQTLFMRWCLDCHRHPERFIRPADKVFDMDYTPPANQEELGRQLMKKYDIHKADLTDCSKCHH
jgi:hypothetical protein